MPMEESSLISDISDDIGVIKPKKKKKKGSSRSVETFYRNAYSTQLDLTRLADNKANMMISINGLIITAIIATEGFFALSGSLPKLLPISVLVVSIMSMVFAMLSARPRVTNLNTTKYDMLNGKANVLYFNNFLSLSETEYSDALYSLIDDTENVYRMMSRHIYSMGMVLVKKYRLLSISYSIFLFGMIINVVLLIGHLY